MLFYIDCNDHVSRLGPDHRGSWQRLIDYYFLSAFGWLHHSLRVWPIFITFITSGTSAWPLFAAEEGLERLCDVHFYFLVLLGLLLGSCVPFGLFSNFWGFIGLILDLLV